MVTINRVSQNTMGESARRVRLALGISQQQIADLAGISRSAVYQYEHGQPVYLDARRKILKTLWSLKTTRRDSLN